MIYIIYFKVLVDFTEYCTTISGHFRRFSQCTCGKMGGGVLHSGALYATITHDPNSEYNQQKSKCNQCQQSWESGCVLRSQQGP